MNISGDKSGKREKNKIMRGKLNQTAPDTE